MAIPIGHIWADLNRTRSLNRGTRGCACQAQLVASLLPIDAHDGGILIAALAAMKRLVLLVPILVFATSVYAESVPLKREGGTYVVPVLINGKITLDFTVDSGAADVSIPADVFSTMVRTKTVAQSDLMGTQVYVLADGSEHSLQRFRIRSLKVGSLEVRNVIGSVSPSAGTLLLGQSFLSRIKSWSIDNERHVFVFNETTLGPVAEAAATRPSSTAKRPSPTAARPAAAVVPPAQADEAIFLKAVNYFFTGDELRGVGVVDRANCIFEVKDNSTVNNSLDKTLKYIIRLNNVDRARSKISHVLDQSYGYHSVQVVLRGEGVAELPAAPAHMVPVFSPFAPAEPDALVPEREASVRSEYTFSVSTDEFDRVVRAWNYIYSHGCKEQKSSF